MAEKIDEDYFIKKYGDPSKAEVGAKAAPAPADTEVNPFAKYGDPSKVKYEPPPSRPGDSVNAFARSAIDRFGLAGFADKLVADRDKIPVEEAVRRGEQLQADSPKADIGGRVVGEGMKAMGIARGLGKVIPWMAGAGVAPSLTTATATGAGLGAVNEGIEGAKKGEMPTPDAAMAKRIGTDAALGFGGGALGYLGAPLLHGASRVANTFAQPIGRAAQEATGRANEFMTKLGVRPTMPQAMRQSGNVEAMDAAGVPQGLLASAARGSAGGSKVVSARQAAQDRISTADDAGLIQSPAAPLYKQAAGERLILTPSATAPTGANISRAQNLLESDEAAMAALRRTLGIPNGAPVPRNSVAYQQAIEQRLGNLRDPALDPNIVARDAQTVQRNIRNQSPIYDEAADTHQQFRRAMEEIGTKGAKAEAPDLAHNVMSAGHLTGDPVTKALSWLPEKLTSKSAADLLLDPANIGMLGKRTRFQDLLSGLPPGLLESIPEDARRRMGL